MKPEWKPRKPKFSRNPIFVRGGKTKYSQLSFQARHPHCVEYKLKYNIKYIKYSQTLHILLDYNSNYMFRPNCRAVFRLIFEQVENS